MPLSVKIICDGNKQIGYGHVSRSITLAQDFIEKGHQVSLSVLSDEKINKYNYKGPFDIYIFDTPTPVDKLIKNKRKNKCVALDYFGKLEVDLSINVYPHKKTLNYKHSVVGHEYIIIRKDIRKLRTKKHNNNKIVTVVLGGGDLLNKGRTIANQLYSKGWKVNLIEGLYNKNYDFLDDGINLFKNPVNYAELLSESDWNITNGGGCLFESICLGKAVWVIPQTKNESIIANWLNKMGVILGFGNKIESYPNSKSIQKTGQSAHKFIDGKGTQRIIDLVEAL